MDIIVKPQTQGRFYLLDIDAEQFDLTEVVDGLARIAAIRSVYVPHNASPTCVLIQLYKGADIRKVRGAILRLARRLSY